MTPGFAPDTILNDIGVDRPVLGEGEVGYDPTLVAVSLGSRHERCRMQPGLEWLLIYGANNASQADFGIYKRVDMLPMLSCTGLVYVIIIFGDRSHIPHWESISYKI